MDSNQKNITLAVIDFLTQVSNLDDERDIDELANVTVQKLIKEKKIKRSCDVAVTNHQLQAYLTGLVKVINQFPEQNAKKK